MIDVARPDVVELGRGCPGPGREWQALDLVQEGGGSPWCATSTLPSVAARDPPLPTTSQGGTREPHHNSAIT
eukprot:scaffold73321_cov36-Tisochrysis_lutea.AAC.3